MRRVTLLFLVFAIELIVLSLSLDGEILLARPGFASRTLGAWGMPLAHFLVSFAALGTALMYLKGRPVLESFYRMMLKVPVRSSVAVLHLALFGGLWAVGRWLYSGSEAQSALLVSVFLCLGTGTLVSGLATIAPLNLWALLASSAGSILAYAAGTALAAVLMSAGWRSLWQAASAVTFGMVQFILRPLLGQLIIEPDKMRVATSRFGVIIAPECSGLEGIGLLLLFGTVWLWLCRKECRFPQALLLLPVGVVTLFVLNSVRIATLVLIGHAGAEDIAARGFHSQAGWIAFNGVAFGLCIAAGRIPWITRVQPAKTTNRTDENPVAVYLGPFLAILAAGMLARAMTGRFEWFYPLRILAAGAVFWAYRNDYRKMDWRFTWRGPVAGVLVFAIWIGLELLLAGSPSEPIPAALQAAPDPARWAWKLARILSATAIVPVAEELAFRGYLLRRLTVEEFDKSMPVRFTIWSVAGSSVLFGAMHGERWLAGTLAGLIYALVYVRREQLAEAAVAHATTNSLIGVAVLWFGWWKLW